MSGINRRQALILDCWDNFEYFKLNPKGKELKLQLPLPVRLVGLRLDKIEKANGSGHADIAAGEIAKLCLQIAALPKESVVIKEAAAALARLEEENFWISASATTGWNSCAPKSSGCFAPFPRPTSRPCASSVSCSNTRWPY